MPLHQCMKLQAAMSLSFLLVFCLGLCSVQSEEAAGPESINVTSGDIRHNYNGSVGGGDYQHTNMYFFKIPKDRMAYVEPEVPSKSWNETIQYPLSVNAWSASSSLSFMLPLVVEKFRLFMARRFLCPTNESQTSDVYVSVSSAAPDPISYRLQVRAIEKGTFVINTLDRKNVDFTVGPAWPEHYEFRFPDGVDAVDIVVTAISDDKGYNQPAVMMIQEARCPMLSEMVQSAKAYRTVSFVRHATTTLVKKNSYPSVFLNFVSTKNSTKPTQKKKLHLTITKSGSDMPYSPPVAAAIGVSLIVFLLPLFCIIGFKLSGRLHPPQPQEDDDTGEVANAASYDGPRDQLVRDPEGEDESPVYPSAPSGRVYWLDIVHYPRVVGALAAVAVVIIVAITLALSQEHEKRDQCYFNYECLRFSGSVSAFNHVFSYGYSYIACAYFIAMYMLLLACLIPGSGLTGPVPRVRPILVAVVASLLAQGIVSAVFNLCPTPYLHFTENSFVILALLLVTAALYGPPSVNFITSLWIAMVVLSAVSESSQLGRAGRPLALAFAALMPFVLAYLHLRNKALSENKSIRQLFSSPITYVTIVWCVAQSAASALLYSAMDSPTFLTCSAVIGSVLYFVVHVGQKRGNRTYWKMISVLLLALCAMVFWALGLTYYLQKRADFTVTPAASRSKNGPCLLGKFYDSNDLWAFFSSFAIFFQLMSFLFYKSI